MIILFVILVSFFIFLYNLYYISREDFDVIRKDISINRIFSLAFLTGLFALLSARFFYAIFHPSPQITDIIGFFSLTYYPGLSLIGGIFGASLFLAVYSKMNKMPIGKMLDLFTFSFITTLPIGFLLLFILSFGKTDLIFNILFLVSFAAALIFTGIVYRFSEKGEIRDGSFTLIFLSVFNLLYFLVKLFTNIKGFAFTDFENVLLVILIFSSLIFLLNQEIMDKFLEK